MLSLSFRYHFSVSILTILIIISLFLAPSALASDKSQWSFNSPTALQGWNLGGIQEPSIIDGDLYFITGSEAAIISPDYLNLSADKLDNFTFIFKTTAPLPVIFAWRRAGDSQFQTNAGVQMQIAPTENFQTITLPLSKIENWNGEISQWALLFKNKDVRVALKEVRFGELSVDERFTKNWQTFWEPEQIRQTTINFLQLIKWGNHSITFYLYWILILGAIGFLGKQFYEKSFTREAYLKAGQHALILGLILWALLDARIFYNWVTWAKYDIGNLLFADAETKRERIELTPDFYPLIRAAKKYIPENGRFWVLQNDTVGYFNSAAKYHLFPREFSEESPDYYLIYNAPEAIFDREKNELTYKGNSLGQVKLLEEISPTVLLLKVD